MSLSKSEIVMNSRLRNRGARGGIAVLVSLALGLGSVLTVVSPSVAAPADGFNYTEVDGKAQLDSCDGSCPDALVIPVEVDGLPVVSIAEGAFDGETLAKVEFAEGSELETIGKNAFDNNDLTTLELPASVTEIGQGAFYRNELRSLIFGGNLSKLESIGSLAFRGNSLTVLELPSTVKTIGAQAFRANNISSLVVPAGVTSIMDIAFGNNSSLNDVRFLGNKPDTFGANIFYTTGSMPIYYKTTTDGWDDVTTLNDREVVGVAPPEITAQPVGGVLPAGGSKQLSVTVKSDVPGQGDLKYRWTKNGVDLSAGTSTYTATSPGTYQVTVDSWVGEVLSSSVVVTAPAPAPRPAIKKVKKKQSVKVKLPSKLKKNRTYKLPARTKQGRAITWRVKGAGKCKINKKKRTITCKRATGKKKFTLVGTAKASSTLYTFKVTIKRRVR